MFTASQVYGTTPSLQPTANAAPSHAASGQPEPFAQTEARAGGFSAKNPTVTLLAMFALAIVLIHFSVGFDIGFSAGAKR